MLPLISSFILASIPGSIANINVNNRYQAKLAARPVLTQSVTSAILFATGDVLAQQLVEKKGIKDHEIARTGRMALYGGGE